MARSARHFWCSRIHWERISTCGSRRSAHLRHDIACCATTAAATGCQRSRRARIPSSGWRAMSWRCRTSSKSITHTSAACRWVAWPGCGWVYMRRNASTGWCCATRRHESVLPSDGMRALTQSTDVASAASPMRSWRSGLRRDSATPPRTPCGECAPCSSQAPQRGMLPRARRCATWTNGPPCRE